MSGRLKVSEYLPRMATRIKRVCALLLMAGFMLAVAAFYIRLEETGKLRAQCNEQEDAHIRYLGLVEEGDAACEAGDKRLGERCYLSALQIHGHEAGLYVKLSGIYREYGRFDLALAILEEFPGEDEGIEAALKALKDEIVQMETSKFKEMEE